MTGPLRRLYLLLRISRAPALLRRYLVVNGFDGALAMLGLLLGFHVSQPVELSVVVGACFGTAIALGVSGVSSAYISEAAERRRALDELEEAMAADLHRSAYGQAARWVPWLVAVVNGAAPLIIALLILLPLWLAQHGVPLPLPPLPSAMVMALLLIFLLGVFLGRIAGRSWLGGGLKATAVALVTIVLILLLRGGL